MDSSVGRQDPFGTRHRTRVLVSLHIVGKLLSWLTGLFRLTPEEKEDAGIYLDHRS